MREDGFTLVEALVGSVLMAMLLGGLLLMLTNGQSSFEAQQADMTIRQSARVAMGRLVAEARLTGYQLGNVPQAISSGSAQVLQFSADIDDGDAAAPCNAGFETATDGGVERLTYALSSTQLLRSVDCWNGSAWSVEISSQVVIDTLIAGQTIFRYFDEDGVEIVPSGMLTSAQRDDVRSIAISLDLLDTTTTQTMGSTYTDYALTGQVELHNLR